MTRIRGMLACGLAALLCLALRIAPATAATSATFTSTADTMLDFASTTRNNGSCTTNTVQAGKTTAIKRVLVQFDVSTITTLGDAAIKTANLNLVQTAAGTDSLRTFNAHRVTSAWGEGAVCGALCSTSGATWANSNAANCTTAWTTAGGDFSPTPTASVTNVTSTSGTTITWGIRNDVQPYVLGTVTNNGTVIKDSLENAGAVNTHTFGMKENATVGNRPTLAVSYLRQATGLTASASSGQNVVNWSLPNTTDYNGALVLRKATTNFTSNASSNPVDTTAYVAGNTIGDGTVVCNITTATTTSCTDTGLTNGTTYFYRVYARDSSVNYSASAVSGSDPTYPKTNATPPDGVTQKYNWDYITGATTLAPPGLTPNGVVVTGSNTSKLYGMDATNNGTQKFAPFATGNAIQGRPPVIPSTFSTTGLTIAYVTSQDGFAYGINTANGTQVWKSLSLGTQLQGGAAVWLQAIKALAVTGNPTQPDLVVVGTRNGDATSNKVYGLNGEDGTTIWTFSPGNMDIIVSTPYIDYASNAIWVTSRSNGSTQTSLWKLNALNGTLAARVPSTGSLGDIDGSPSASLDATVTSAPSFIYVPTNAGNLIAVKTSDNSTVTHTPASGTGAIQGFPLSFSFSTPSVSTPDRIVFSRTATVHAVSWNGTSFTAPWTTTPTGSPASISAAVDNFDGTKVYVGGSDGKVHQLRVSDGVDEAQVSTLATQTVGDPSFDVSTLNRVYVGAADGRIYSFTSPF